MGNPGANAAAHELDAPPWQRVESTLMATARGIRQAYDQRLGALEVNLSQASLLSFVADFGSQTQTRLAGGLGLGRAATGTLVDGLEARGLVVRTPDPTDRRVWLVDLTAAGRAVVDRVADVDRTLRAELRAGISKAERHQLAQLLVRLQANLAGVLADDPEGTP